MLNAASCRFQEEAISLPTRYIDISFLVNVNLQINFFRFSLDTTLRNAGATHFTDEETEACFVSKGFSGRRVCEMKTLDSKLLSSFSPPHPLEDPRGPPNLCYIETYPGEGKPRQKAPWHVDSISSRSSPGRHPSSSLRTTAEILHVMLSSLTTTLVSMASLSV